LDKTPGRFGEFKPEQSSARSEHQIEAGRHERLILAINFAQAALGPVALHGIAHRSARSNDTHAGIGRGTGRPNAPSQKKDAAINAATLFSDSAEIGVAPQALTGGQSHGWARGVRHAEF